MSENCDRCGREITNEDFEREVIVEHVATHGTVKKAIPTPNGEIPAGSMLFGDSWYALCPECTQDFRQWHMMFMHEGESIAMYGRQG